MSGKQHSLQLCVMEGRFAVCRLDPGSEVPAQAPGTPFHSVTRTPDELSLVCAEESAPRGEKAVWGWRCLRVVGPLDFSLTGILSSLASPLAERDISIFSISTFDTDYLLVKDEQLASTLAALEEAGHTIRDTD